MMMTQFGMARGRTKPNNKKCKAEQEKSNAYQYPIHCFHEVRCVPT
jgi:hypothetical protein